jgi:trk system potassium uptake protein TrkH
MILGALQFLFSEWTNLATIGNVSIKEKIIHSIFHSITRTAGFSLLDYNSIHNSTSITTIALMFIGGSSLSVAGGIKVGTLSIIAVSLISTIIGKEEVVLFKRTVNRDIIRRSLIIFIFSIIIIIFSFMIISSFEPDTIFRELLFECVSAFGNVGLTTGITGSLNESSKILISFLMIVGRFGPMLLALMFVGRRSMSKAKPAYEIVRIG